MLKIVVVGKLDDITTKQARDDAYVLIVETAIEESEHRRTAVIVEYIDLLVILIRRIQTHQEEVLFKKVGKGNVKTQIYTSKSFDKYPHWNDLEPQELDWILRNEFLEPITTILSPAPDE
ncbi:hypothetical protein TNCV_28911 [Trichonephila clavipes]|nr:hypothetical protein TNCV_28911 [Trichonephila clavipes]